jgi:hypothetical protein
MTISSAQHTITTSRSIIVADDLAAEQVAIHSGSGTVYIGGADVTIANGYKMDNGDKLVIDNHTNAIYAVAASGTPSVFTLVIQK